MASPQVTSSAYTNDQSGAGNHTLNYPSGTINSGDLLICVIATDGDNSISNWDVTDDWTEIWSGDDGKDIFLAVAYRTADGDESGSTFNVAVSNSETSAAIVLVITGGTTPEGTGTTGDSNTPDPPNYSTSDGVKDYLWIAAVGIDNAVDITAFPYADNNLETTQSNPGGVTCALCTDELTGEEQNPGTFTAAGSGDEWATATIAIHPAAAATNINVSNKGSVTIVGNDPTVLTDIDVNQAAKGSVTVTGNDPAVTFTQTIAQNAKGSVTVSGYGLTVLTDIDVNQSAEGSVTVAGYDATVNAETDVDQVAKGSVTIAGYGATVNAETDIDQSAKGSITVAGHFVTVELPGVGVDVDVSNVGAIAVAGYDASFNVETDVNVGLGQVTVAGYNAVVNAETDVDVANVGAIAIAGYDPTVLTDIDVNQGNLGQVAVAGYDPAVLAATLIDAGKGSITVAGYNPSVSVPLNVNAGNVGAIAITGHNASVELVYPVSCVGLDLQTGQIKIVSGNTKFVILI